MEITYAEWERLEAPDRDRVLAMLWTLNPDAATEILRAWVEESLWGHSRYLAGATHGPTYEESDLLWKGCSLRQ